MRSPSQLWRNNDDDETEENGEEGFYPNIKGTSSLVYSWGWLSANGLYAVMLVYVDSFVFSS